MNNLGGYKSIELIFVDELTAFAVTTSGVYIRKNQEKQRILPIHQYGATADTSSKTEKAGTLYTHKATIKILSSRPDKQLHAELSHVDVRGCILIATTNNNEKRVFGHSLYPLFGSFSEIPGQKPSDSHCYELVLSASCTTPALPLIE